MIVVADTSPLNYLIQIDADPVLPKLYSQVLIPQQVFDEMRHAGAKPAVRMWAMAFPRWVEVRPVQSFPTELLEKLDLGEASAIQLAKETGSSLLLDDLRARKEAALAGLSSTGTLGVLLEAHRRGIVDGFVCLRRLREETNFYLSAALEADFLVALSDTG